MITLSVLRIRSKELLQVSAPLMISFLSLLTMLFANRVFLANYSLDALTATVSAGTLAFSVTFGIQTLTLIASVFVAQLHGAGKLQQIGAPVWQMIWLSLASFVLVIPIACLAKYVLFSNSALAEQQILVFQCIMWVSPLFALLGGLQSFYNGRGKTLVITYLSLLANTINIILDPILIFGIDGVIPSMGIVGAYIANAIGLLVLIIILFYLFLKADNRLKFGSNNWKFNFSLMQDCIKIGAPEAVGVGAEILCWGIFYNMMVTLGEMQIIVTSIAQSIVLLLIFFGLGLEQGAAILAGNFIGAGRKQHVHEILQVGTIIVLCCTIVIIVLFTSYPEFIVKWFFYKQNHLDLGAKGKTAEIMVQATSIISECLLLVALYIGCEAIRWIINGLLRAAGDTLFLLWVGVINIILFMIVPTYVLMIVYEMPIQVFFKIWLFFAVASTAISYIRFKRGIWKNIVIKSLQ